jgi:hypothetical protein
MSNFPNRLEIRDGLVPEVHLWLAPSEPASSRGRTHDGHRRSRDDTIHYPSLEADADAGAPGEWNPASDPSRGGDPHDPQERRGPNGERAPTAGGVQPPQFVDAVRITGRDASGKRFEQVIWGPDPARQSQSWARVGIGDSRVGLLHGLIDDQHVQQLGEFQRLLNAHYGNTR